ncbi:hypothetical protein [Mesorhizobium sp. 1B3]|uniref:hypothetical protein n=1 Tax=Mesorhizobium sp. 1B3 TaxID=3243599 RepID=UPI003D98E365
MSRTGRSAAEFRHHSFWALFDERHPDERARRARRGPWFWQRGLPAFEVVITMYVAPEQNVVGVFFGRNERLGAVQVGQRLEPYRAAFENRLSLRPEQSADGLGVNSIWRVNCYAEDNWPAMADWLVTEATRFERAVAEILGAGRQA